MSEVALTDHRDPLLRVYIDYTHPQAYVSYRHAGGARRQTTLRAQEMSADPGEAWAKVQRWVREREGQGG